MFNLKSNYFWSILLFINAIIREKNWIPEVLYTMKLKNGICRLQITKRSFRISVTSIWNKLHLAIQIIHLNMYIYIRRAQYIHIYIYIYIYIYIT